LSTSLDLPNSQVRSSGAKVTGHSTPAESAPRRVSVRREIGKE